MTRRRDRRGVALLLALLVVTVLSVLVVPFHYDGRVERAVAANLYTGLQAGYLARSGVALAEALLLHDQQASPQHDGLDPQEIWHQANGVPLPLGGGTVTLEVTDEAGKINLNVLATSNKDVRDTWTAILQRLLMLQGQQDEQTAKALVETLVDWVDADDAVTGFAGAEASYYQSLDPPYAPANAPLRTVAELRRVKGWNDPKLLGAVAPFVTVYGATTGAPAKVNANTASPEVLMALDDAIDEGCAGAIVAHRRERPFKSGTDIRQVSCLAGPGLEGLLNRLDTKGRAFGVTATAGFRDSVALVRAVLEREGAKIERVYWRAE